MKAAIVHDYIKEFGGAERVLEALCEIYPDAAIYTAFVDKNSSAYSHFKNKKIVSSWFNLLPFAGKLASPLRFLTPFIWGSFNFKDFDVVISSASWFITKGFKRSNSKFFYCKFQRGAIKDSKILQKRFNSNLSSSVTSCW